MRHAVILAGGSGTRLWPASRRARPKQLLALARNGETMIDAAITLGQAVSHDRPVIVTAEALPDVRGEDQLIEPAPRNTAAAIALAGATIAERDPEATIVVLPADHHVRDHEGMIGALDACLTAAEKNDAIALVGIPPTRPETGYGYLEMAAGPSDGVRSVLRFVEKPNRATAERYLASGQYLWNAGIFCLTARRLLSELDAHMPQVARAAISIARGNHSARAAYEALPSVSFDKGVMEKTDRVVAISAAVGWNDVGSWAALPEVRGRDADGNTISGQAVVLDGKGNVVMTDDETLVAMIGVSDLVVVKAGNAILVVPKEQAQRVREVVEALGARGLARCL